MAQISQANGTTTTVGTTSFSGMVDSCATTQLPNGANNFSTTSQQVNAATTATLTGSTITIPAAKLKIGTTFQFNIALTKSAAGTAANTFNVRLGTTGGTSDASILAFATPTATGVVDTGSINMLVTIRGPLSASCVAQGNFIMSHNLSATGFANVPVVCINTTSGTFDATASALIISASVTTAASTVLTFQQVVTSATNLV